MRSDENRDGGGWGPWALVVGVAAVGLLGLARELRDRRRDGGTGDEATGGDADVGTDGTP